MFSNPRPSLARILEERCLRVELIDIINRTPGPKVTHPSSELEVQIYVYLNSFYH